MVGTTPVILYHAPGPPAVPAREAAAARQNGPTRLQKTRRAWDYIISAHYHYGPKGQGYRSVAILFDMPPSTVKSIIQRTPRANPEVWHAAVRFGLVRVRLVSGAPSA